jgi:hypothetical protein
MSWLRWAVATWGFARSRYLKANEAVLRARLTERAERFDANAAFPIADELLTQFLSAFEAPSDEGEEVVVVSGG